MSAMWSKYVFARNLCVAGIFSFGWNAVQGQSSRLSTAPLYGSAYVRAVDMARAYGLQSTSAGTTLTRAADRGVHRARFYVLQHVRCPATLVECGFLSNQLEADLIWSVNYREQLAGGIAQGIIAHKRTLEQSERSQ